MLKCPLCDCESPLLLAQINAKSYWRYRVCFLAFLSLEQRPDAEAELQRYLQHENSPGDHRYWDFLSHLFSYLVPRLLPGAGAWIMGPVRGRPSR
jgi:hypothetical protein